VESLIANVILSILVIVLGGLLIIRQRQLKRVLPPTDLSTVLDNLKENLLSSRTEGKIQKVAGQLSDILINNLQSEKILFFRKQRRFMEMNYVYGMKNIQRAKYRIRLSNELLDKLTDGTLLRAPADLKDLLNPELVDLLEAEKFSLIFPIFWTDNLFGVYFIRTELAVDHPVIKAFLLFLNQNLSVAYQITRLESSRQILESKVENDKKKIKELEENIVQAGQKEPEDDPGHLIEMFGHRTVDDLVASLFDKVRAGLKAEKLVFVTRPNPKAAKRLDYALGIQRDSFTLNGEEFQKIFGTLQKRQVYDVARIGDLNLKDQEHLLRLITKEKIDHMTTFSLSENDQGLLFWSEKPGGEQTGNRVLPRLERVARRALVNAREFERVEAMSYTDGLTGLYNHRYFIKRLNEEIQRAVRYSRKVGLLLFDIDDFKLYNDNFGHQWGDELLRRMGKTLAKSLRAIDIVARYGGDEFSIIMPEADKATCGIFMDRLRHAIAATDFRDQVNGFEGRITISIGSAIFPDDADNLDRLIYCADMALFRSKDMGRNRSTIYSEDMLEPDSHH